MKKSGLPVPDWRTRPACMVGLRMPYEASWNRFYSYLLQQYLLQQLGKLVYTGRIDRTGNWERVWR